MPPLYGWVKNNWIKSNGSEVKHKSLWFKFLGFKKKIDVTLIYVERNSDHGIIKAYLLISLNDLEINKSLIYASCVMCSDKDDNDMIECSICHNWIHFQCTKLPAYQIQIFIDTMRKFTCENCADQPEEELAIKCFDNCLFEILQLKDNIIDEKSKESERLQNEIIMIRRRCEEIENTHTKKINNYKTQTSELSAKAESHII